jgi:hypothetical protein
MPVAVCTDGMRHAAYMAAATAARRLDNTSSGTLAWVQQLQKLCMQLNYAC